MKNCAFRIVATLLECSAFHVGIRGVVEVRQATGGLVNAD